MGGAAGYLALCLSACLSNPAGGAPDAVPSFRNDIIPLLTRAGCNSGACHGAAAGKNGFKLSLRGYDPESDHAVLTRQAAGRRVARGDPEHSLMLLKPSARVPHAGGERLKPGSDDYNAVALWIAAGALPPLESDPRIESIEVAPAQEMLEVGAERQVAVRARYSDGTSRDVTRWTKFGTSAEGVVAVDAGGKAKVVSPGEAAVTAWFQSKVAYARLGARYPPPRSPRGDVLRDEELYGSPDRRGFIDDRILEKLKALRIAPSPLASDAEFIRRVFLDAAGILPTPRDVQRFVLDAAPGKRERLVDELLAREEFTDFWAYRWSDLLLLSSRKLPGDSLNAFYRFIRQSVAADKPWDRFAREILTATGATGENGAAAYFLMHKDPIDLTETTSQTFLGMSITCARCHNHPLEKWLQNDYYGMANLFARVKLKNGDRSGEAVVLTSDAGEVLHPRLGEPMPPRPLDGTPLGPSDPRDRREALADWLTAPGNPYFTRALVNRVWKTLMGRALVEPEDDLRLTNPASNERLMSELCEEFVRGGFHVKRLVREVLLSAAYQRSSRPFGGNEADGIYYSHYIVRRLPAEVLLDAYSQVTGAPTDFPGYPRGFRALQLPDSQVPSYFLKAFGRPDRNITCSCERQGESSLPQALHVANGDTLDRKLKAPGNALGAALDRNLPDEEIVDGIFLAALARYPSEGERKEALEALAAAKREKDPPAAKRMVLEDLTWAILAGKEFIFNR